MEAKSAQRCERKRRVERSNATDGPRFTATGLSQRAGGACTSKAQILQCDAWVENAAA
jgi:hypothetical protein